MPPKKAGSLDGGVNKNGRRSAKSRTGCQTCKVKRLKCDEAKPACRNCVKRGLACPGYKQVLRWSTKYEASQPEGSSQTVIHPSIEYQFSAIDPSSFGENLSEDAKGRPGTVEPKNGQADAQVASEHTTVAGLSDELISSNTHDNSDLADLDLIPDWPVDLSALLEPEEQSLVPFERSLDDQIQSRRPHEEIQRRVKANNGDSDMSQTQWKSLLRSYYRMNAPAPTRSLHTEASALVEHYFHDVCVIFSAYDSPMNPFRTVIGRLWDNSSSIFFAIQSMAAAHLANYMPDMRVTGLAMQRKAYECLQQELQLASINRTMDDKLLLAVLLLGLTACWHDSSDLGVAHLSAARALIQPRLLSEDGLQGTDSTLNDQFFAEALIYWETCMAFVSQETFVPGMERRLPPNPLEDEEASKDRMVFPHPWTGIAPRVLMLFAEVGRLVKHYCTKRHALFDILQPLDMDMDMNAIITAATDLEEELLSICIPTADQLVDVQDERTKKSDFINIAEATKCAALLEIYRAFPEILAGRLGSVETADSHTTFFAFQQDNSRGLDLGNTSWLTSLATHVLNLLASVPTSSGTRPQQLILLVTAAAELRLKGPSVCSPGLSESTSYDLEVARARGFAMTRLNELASRLPSKPVLIIIKLVREVWRRNDAGENVFWMDVMTENGWETIMG